VKNLLLIAALLGLSSLSLANEEAEVCTDPATGEVMDCPEAE